ncbi:16840_t:CDS:2, partial [Gigaspora rosea]
PCDDSYSTLKQKFTIHPGRVRRPRLLLHKQTRLVANNSQDVSINNILNDGYSNLEDALTNNNGFEDSNKSDDNIEYSNDVSINNSNSEDSSEDKYNDLEEISDSPEDSNEDDNLGDSNNNFEDITIDSDDFEGSNDDFEENLADGPDSFEPFNGKYGPYFANFTEQMFFL